MTESQSPYNVTTESHEPAAAATGDAAIVALVEELLRDAEPGYMLRQEVMHTGFFTARECWEGYQVYVRARLRKALGGQS